jgi:acetyl esterase/lipase
LEQITPYFLMDYRQSAIFNALQLPAYWRACRRTREQMDIRVSTISYGPHARQYYLDIRTSNQQALPSRHAFYFHGGAWTFGRPETFIPAALPWLEAGFRVIMPSYRRLPQAWLPTIVQDCRAAISHAAPDHQAQTLHLGGISAGGHLAALLACQTDWWQSTAWNISPSKALICAAPTSFGHLRPKILFTPHPELDPVRQIREASVKGPSWYLLHGTADATVKYKHSLIFSKVLAEKGHPVYLHTIPNGTHLDAGRWMFGEVAEAEVKEFIREGLG